MYPAQSNQSSKAATSQQQQLDASQQQISLLETKITSLEEQIQVSQDQQKTIMLQNQLYVKQHKEVQEAMERVHKLFQNEQGEQININLQTHLEKKISDKILNELKFNQITSAMDTKFRESSHKLHVTCEALKEQQEMVLLSLKLLQHDMKENANQIHQNSLFIEQMDRIEEKEERLSKTQQEILDRVWKQEESIQFYAEQISQKVNQEEVLSIQAHLKENFIGTQFFASQNQMLLDKINSKTDSIHFEERINYIDKAVMQTSQKFEEQFQKDLKIVLIPILEAYITKQDLDRGLSILRKETKISIQNAEDIFEQKVKEIHSSISLVDEKVKRAQKEIDQIKLDAIAQIENGKTKHEDILQKISGLDKKLFFQNEELIKKIDLKPSHKDMRGILQQVDTKFQDQQGVISQLSKGIENKQEEVENSLKVLTIKLMGVVTSDELNTKLEFLNILRSEAENIISDQETFKKQLVKFEERLSVKISKFEIDQLKNALTLEFVKKHVFDSAIFDFQEGIQKNLEAINASRKENSQKVLDLSEQIILQLHEALTKVQKTDNKVQAQQEQIRLEQNQIREQMQLCKVIVQKSDESILLKASKIDLEHWTTKITEEYLDKVALSKFMDERDEVLQLKNLEDEIQQFKHEYKQWKDAFNQRMSFSVDLNKSPNSHCAPFDWVEEVISRMQDFDHMKSQMAHKANHSDLIQLFSSKANKSVVNSIYSICSIIRKQQIYEIISLQSFMKGLSSKQDLPPAQVNQIQLNLKQLTKLLEWISYSVEDQQADIYQDNNYKPEPSLPQFSQMEKLSESVVSKFKLFQKAKKEDIGFKFNAFENKMLDEYLSAISQEPPSENYNGNPLHRVDFNQDIEVMRAASAADYDSHRFSPIRNELSTQSQLSNRVTQNQPPSRQIPVRKRQSQPQPFTMDHFFPIKNDTIRVATGATSHRDPIRRSNETSAILNSSLIVSDSRHNGSVMSIDTTAEKKRSSSQNQNNKSSSKNFNHDFSNNSSQIDSMIVQIGSNAYEVNDLKRYQQDILDIDADGQKSQQFHRFINSSIKNLPQSSQTARSTTPAQSQIATSSARPASQTYNLSTQITRQQLLQNSANLNTSLFSQEGSRQPQLSPLNNKQKPQQLSTGNTPFIKHRVINANQNPPVKG